MSSPTSRQCTECGAQLTSADVFCTGCGAPANSDETAVTRDATATGDTLFIEALKLCLAKGSGIPAMPLFQKAIALGLKPEDEVEARVSLGDGYREIVGNSGLSWEQMVRAPEFRSCLLQVEKALDLDRENSIGFFSKPLNIGRLKRVDLMYTLASNAIEEREGIDQAISYLVDKLKATCHLARSPFLATQLELGRLYQQRGSFEDASRCLNRVLHSEPLYPADEQRNRELRNTAQQLLNEIESQQRLSFNRTFAYPQYCNKCGASVSIGSRFCTSCGTKIAEFKVAG